MPDLATRAWTRLVIVILLVAMLPGLTMVSAQVGDAPLVGFVVDGDLGTASLTDLGVTGLNRFAEVFRAYGAQVTPIDLRRAIPDEVDLVVLVRPIRSFTIPQIARLWFHLQKGGNLLLAIDPENYFIGNANINTQIARSGFTTLLALDYGILLRDTFLVEPWFTTNTITRLETTYSRTFVDVVAHPVVAQLRAFGLPVYVWGARTMAVEPLGIDSVAVPLLYNANGYAETNPGVFRRLRGNRFENATQPLQENIGTDFLGWANVAALAEHTGRGSRVAVLGDSEMLLNAYGFLGSPEARAYPGNVVFAQNLAGWLLERPSSQWLSLPPGFTWLTVDGSANEWPDAASTVSDSVDPGAAANRDIQSVRAFHDNIYSYFYIETWERVSPDVRLEFRFADGTRVTAADGSIIALIGPGQTEQITGAAIGLRSGVEVRLPLRTTQSGVTDICMRGSASDDLGIADCLGQPVPVPQFNTRAPFDLGLSDGLLVTVSNNTSVNLRSGPSTATSVVTMVPNGTVFAALGRNADSSWVRVQNAGQSGWISAGLVVANGDIGSLPVLDSET